MAASATRKPIDLRGMPCVFVLAEIERALAEQDGDVTILCDHPTTIHETVPEYCGCHQYKLTVEPEIYPLHGQVYRLRIES